MVRRSRLAVGARYGRHETRESRRMLGLPKRRVLVLREHQERGRTQPRGVDTARAPERTFVTVFSDEDVPIKKIFNLGGRGPDNHRNRLLASDPARRI